MAAQIGRNDPDVREALGETQKAKAVRLDPVEAQNGPPGAKCGDEQG